MLDISFEVGGRKINPNQIGDAMERAVFESVREQLVSKLRDIRDPETGAAPKLKVTGRSLQDLSVQVEGSEALIGLVKKRLGG